MKNSMLFLLLFMPFCCFSQFTDRFTDGNFTQDPTWSGIISNFIVNTNNQLQSNAIAASTSYLFTPSQAIENALWECQVIIDYPTSSSNYACIYLVSDKQSIENGFNGYFVQIGGTNDEVSLYLQQGTQKVKIIDGMDKRTDLKLLNINIKVTRDSTSVFTLYSKLSTDDEYVLEGTVQNDKVLINNYFGLSFTNTSTTGKCYFFDDIHVSGEKIIDTFSPEWISLGVKFPDTIKCVFSESMNFDKLLVSVNNLPISVLDKNTNPDMTELVLSTDFVFEAGNLYQVQLEGLTDLSGNALMNKEKTYAALEKICQGDIIFNEVMFHQPDSSYEYIELYNRSEKLIGLSGMVYTTRKTDGTLNTGNKIPEGVFVSPLSCVAFTQNAASVKKYHNCPENAKVIQSGWSALNNESATLVLTNTLKDTVYDELFYHASMHHVLIKNPKGVALERIYADLPTDDITNWHSAAFGNNYGTPGFKNSQYRELDSSEIEDHPKFLIENKVFSPDNDGIDDLCILKYSLEHEGYVANMLILSATGEQVFKLSSNHLLAANGQIIWDGRNSAGKVANIGIYVVFIQLFHPEYGKRNEFKIPVVLSSR